MRTMPANPENDHHFMGRLVSGHQSGSSTLQERAAAALKHWLANSQYWELPSLADELSDTLACTP